MTWATFWIGFAFVVLVSYAALAVVVSIRGFSDVKRLLDKMKEP